LINLKHQNRAGYISAIIPSIAFAIAFFIPGILALDYIHVLFGALWTGTDVFLGMIFLIVLSGMDNNVRANIAHRLIPMTMYFIPAVSIITPLSGFLLALREHIFKFNLFFSAVLIISFILIILTYIVIFPLTLKNYREFKRENYDTCKISRNLMNIAKIASVQFALQIVIISLMAVIVVFGGHSSIVLT
jgi:uncharacterized membrane protein